MPQQTIPFYRGILEKDYQTSLKLSRGKEWLIGNFRQFNKSLRKTGLLELKYWNIMNNQEHQAKTQETAGEITIVLRGWIKGVVGGKGVILKAGEYIYIPPNTLNNLVQTASKNAKGITIKAPSDPRDSIKTAYRRHRQCARIVKLK